MFYERIVEAILTTEDIPHFHWKYGIVLYNKLLEIFHENNICSSLY